MYVLLSFGAWKFLSLLGEHSIRSIRSHFEKPSFGDMCLPSKHMFTVFSWIFGSFLYFPVLAFGFALVVVPEGGLPSSRGPIGQWVRRVGDSVLPCLSPCGCEPLEPWNPRDGRGRGGMHHGRFTSTFPMSTTRNPMLERRTHNENVAFLAFPSSKHKPKERARTCPSGRTEAWKCIRTTTRPSKTPCSRIHCVDH